MADDHGRRGGRWRLAAFAVLSAIVVLCHPYSAFFLAVVTVTLVFARTPNGQPRVAPVIFAAGAVGGLIAASWPYFPLLQLLTTDAAAYYPEQHPMYVDVLPRLLPALLGAPFLILRATRERRDPLVLGAIVFSIVYAFGGLTGQFVYGRVLPFIVLDLHLALAIGLAEFAQRISRPLARIGLVAVVAIPVLALGWTGFHSQLRSLGGDQALVSLIRQTGATDVVIADLEVGRAIPAYGGRDVGWPGALPFVPDLAQRNASVKAFFERATTQAERVVTIRRYRVTWILLDQRAAPIPSDVRAALLRLGSVAGGDSLRLTLIRVDACLVNASCPAPPD
ncbi:MAG: hypothetical protein ACYDAK_11870 [Candidatus Limnocylindrales bacterium]